MAAANKQFRSKEGYDWMDRRRFLKEYDLKLEYEFSHDDHTAEWAHRGHRFWSNADGMITLETGDPDMNQNYPQSAAALSQDNRLLAISTNAVIRIYNVQSKRVISELRGHEENVQQIHFALLPPDSSSDVNASKRYTLVSFGLRNWVDGRIIVWHLGGRGQTLSTIPISSPVHSLAHRAVASIARELVQQHGIAFGNLPVLRSEIASSIQEAVSKDPIRDGQALRAKLPTFGFGNPISSDGKKLITLEKNESTQQGMRPLEEMPRIVVRNLADLREEWRLTGHQDAIMWAGWSPDDKWIAEASWDETYGIWNPTVGDFSFDGKYIVFSGGYPTKVAVYEVETGEEVAVLQYGFRRGTWVRELKWSPIDYTLAVIIEHEVVLWHPLDDNTFTSVLKVETDRTLLTRFNELILVKWVDEGQKMLVRDTANTVFLWDIRMNKKWRFQRPKGLPLATNPRDVFFIKRLAKEGAVLSLDGDGKVRYWNL